MKFVATCAAGLEQLVKEEIEELGGTSIKTSIGSVEWSGVLESGYRACLWSRFSSRVLLVIETCQAENEDELYDKVKDVSWTDHLDSSSTFAVDCALAAGAPFSHSKYTALKVKDGIADYFREKTGTRPNVRTTRPDVRVNVYADRERAMLSVDLSGESMHRRGYRLESGEAPLKETLAAAIITLSGWNGSTPLVDPMCGSATLLIEAAMIWGDSAPGLGRSYFGMHGWAGHDDRLWSFLLSEAVEREIAGGEKEWPQLIGYDADKTSIRSARANIKSAGFEDRIQVSRGELFSLQPPDKAGTLVCNPPYGERLSEKQVVKYLYRALGNRFQLSFPGWRTGLFTSNPDLADMTLLTWDKNHRLFNGAIACRLFVGSVDSKQPQRFIWNTFPTKQAEPGGDFSNRLRKNCKTMMRWAQREGVECFRIYDRDLIEYNVSIDIYGKWVHVQEYAAPSSIPESVASERFQAILRGVRTVLGIGRDRIFIKQRKRQKGKSQYEKRTKKPGKMYEVREGSCSFLVNFTDYLDTGLFLDHRNTRQMIGRKADAKRFLNLYGYTGSATVHAVIGGAASSTTVDLSSTYLRWAEMNMALNGIFPGRHQLVQADCIEWLKQSDEMYDLIFVDPPTFSNTRKKARVFDVQTQHGELINLSMARLRDTGLLIFSTNFRSFRFDQKLCELYDCVNLGTQTLPKDFRRTPPIHQCWKIRHRC